MHQRRSRYCQRALKRPPVIDRVGGDDDLRNFGFLSTNSVVRVDKLARGVCLCVATVTFELNDRCMLVYLETR